MKLKRRHCVVAALASAWAAQIADAALLTLDNENFSNTVTAGSQSNLYGQSFDLNVGGIGTTDTATAYNTSPGLPATVYLDSAQFVRAPSGTGTTGNLYVELFTGGNGSSGTYVGTSTNSININSAGYNAALTFSFNKLALSSTSEYTAEFTTSATGAGTAVTGRIEAANAGSGFVNTYSGGVSSGSSATFATSTAYDSRFLLTFDTSLISSAQNLTWDNAGGTGDGVTWDTAQPNFNNGSGATAFSSANQDNVSFTDVNNNNYNISIPTTVTPGSTVVSTSKTYTFSGTGGIGGSGGLTLSGGGTLALTGSDSYTGSTNVSSGTLSLAVSGAIQTSAALNLGDANTGSSNVTVLLAGGATCSNPISVSNLGSGTITLAANGNATSTYSGVVTLNSSVIFNNTNTFNAVSLPYSGPTIASGGLNISGGSMTGVGGVTFTGGGTSLLLTADTSYFAYTGATVVTGNTLLEYYSSKSTNPNSVMSISSGSEVLTAALSAGEFGGLTGGGYLTASTQGASYLTIGYLNDAADNFSGVISGAYALTKTGTGMQVLSGSNTYTGSTTISGGVLQAGVATVPGVSGAFGNNTNVTISAGTLDLNGFNTSIGTLSGSGAVTLGSATLTLNGTSSSSFSGTISGTGGLVINTTATQTLSGTNNYSGATNVAAGTLVIGVTGALPSGTALSVAGGATLVLDSQTTASSIGSLNLNGNAIVHGGSLSLLTAAIQQGYNGGAWNGSGAGVISSSAAAADPLHLHALGIIQNDNGAGTSTPIYTTFEGQSISDSDTLIKYTYYGDANLDGQVDGSDYTLIDNGFINHLTGWYNGDFNYDGVVDGSDYTLIDNAFNTQGAQIAAQFSAVSATSAAQFADTGSPVPEPGSITLLAIGATGLLSRRCRRL